MFYIYDLLEELPTGAPAAPALVANTTWQMAHIRKVPFALKVMPFTAGIPPPAAAPTITGSTLPFMGVG